MTERLYYYDSYLTEFQAQVVSQSEDGLRVVLDRTAFYPTSGGQPHDIGLLNDSAVVEVTDLGDTVEHILATPLVGRDVKGSIDWPRRLDHMQQHTAQHLLSALLQEDFDFTTVSFHLGKEESTIDIEPATLSESRLAEVELRANHLLRQNLATNISFEDSAQVEGLRKANSRSGLLRIVSIDSLDRSACGGTHVSRTGEIGFLRLGKTEKIRKALRLYFYAGIRATAFTQRQLDALRDSEANLRHRLAESEKLVQKLSAELAALRGAQMISQIAPDAMGRRLWAEERTVIGDDARWEANAFLVQPGAIVLFYSAATGSCLLGSEVSTGLDCGAIFKRLTSSRGGRGGGNPRMAQGNLGMQLSLEDLLKEVLVH